MNVADKPTPHEQPFAAFPKMARFSRTCIITEKIDGTNAQILIARSTEGNRPSPRYAVSIAPTEDHDATGDFYHIYAGSRTRWITPDNDNYGFARWVQNNALELVKLGEGRHFGEWWGSGIQRGYGLKNGDKRLSLFNVARWCLHGKEPARIPSADPSQIKMQDVLPEIVGLVPVICVGDFDAVNIEVKTALDDLRTCGSYAAPGFMKPEGIVVFHTAGDVGFKKTLDNDGIPKSLVSI